MSEHEELRKRRRRVERKERKQSDPWFGRRRSTEHKNKAKEKERRKAKGRTVREDWE